MTVDDRQRLELHRKLETTIGREHADTLMAHLPPVTWDRVATKDDLDANRVLLRVDIQAMARDLRTEMQTMETGIRTDIRTMETGLRAEMQASAAGLRTEMLEQSNRQLRWIITFMAAWSTLLLAAVQLLP